MNKVFVIAILLGAIFFSEIIAQEIVQKKEILSVEYGRFVFGQISEARRDQYMLDTKTGRLWQIVVNNEDVKSLQPVLYISLDGVKTIEPEEPDIQLNRVKELMGKHQETSEPEIIKPNK
jgi:hypothetical protein